MEDDRAEAPGDEAVPEDRGSGGLGALSDRASLIFVVGLAVIVLVSMVRSSGIWDPYELDAADLARRIAVNALGAKDLALPGAQNAMPTLSDLRAGELGFTSMAVGFRLLGLHDYSGRLPLALWALAGVVATYGMLARLVDKRAGIYASIALVTMPLYVLGARTMLGDVVTMASLAIAFAGLAGAVLDDRDPAWARPAWLALGALGLASGYLCRGLFIGVAIPALGVGLGWAALRAAGFFKASPSRGAIDLYGALVLGAGFVAVGFGLRALTKAPIDGSVLRAIGAPLLKKPPTEATFDLVVRQLGHALFPWSALLPFVIGRVLRPPVEAGDSERDRDVGLRVLLIVGSAVAYGVFALLAPKVGAIAFSAPALLAAAVGLALLDFERGAPPSRAAAIGCLALGFVLYSDITREPARALAPFVVEKPVFPKSFEDQNARAMGAAIVVFALLAALSWFEEQPREEGDRRGVRPWIDARIDDYKAGVADLSQVWGGNLLFGMVVIEAALVGLGAMIFIGKRIAWAPVDKLPKLGVEIGLNVWWALPVALAALPIALFLVRDGFRVMVSRSRAPRAVFTAIAALGAGGLLSFWYYPALASQISPKEAFETYGKLRAQHDPLALLGVRGRAAAYYARGEVESFNDATRAFAWLVEQPAHEPSQRRFLILKADDLPKINSLYRAKNKVNLPIVDGRSSQILLASNKLGDAKNQSYLGSIVLDDPPSPQFPADAMFEDQLQLVGWEVRDQAGAIVTSVVPVKRYHLRFFLRVLKPITTAWKAFVHIDGHQRRFNGDHAVVDGRYAMNLWQPGDVVVDDLPFQLEPNFTTGDYTVYMGFFSGDMRFRVTRGQQHDNRVIAGMLHVR